MIHKTYDRYIFLFLVIALIFASFGISADLADSRVSTEKEQIAFALKFGSGDLNPHHFLHPAFLSYVLFGFYGAFFTIGKLLGTFPSVTAFERLYFSDPSIFFLIARIFVLVLLLVAIFVTYKIAHKTFNRRTALIASCFMVFSPVVIKWSHYASADIPLMCISLLTFIFCLRIFQKGLVRDYCICGLLIGLSVATKYNGAPLIAPFLVAHFCCSANERWPQRIFSPKLIKGVCFIVFGFFIGAPFSFLDYQTFLSELSRGWARSTSGEYNFSTWQTDKPGWIYILTNTIPFGLTIPIAIVTLLGLGHACWRRKQVDYLFLSFIALAYLMAGNSIFLKPRHFLLIFPFMFILGARAITEIAENISPVKKTQHLLIAVTSMLLVVPAAINIIKFDYRIAQPHVGLEAKEWIEENIPSNTKIASFNGLPLKANRDSLERQLKEIQEKNLGQGIEIQKHIQHNDIFDVTYDLTILPVPWNETYDREDFDFDNHIREGIKYFIFTKELEEYLSDSQTYKLQVAYYNAVREHCLLIKEFRKLSVELEPGHLGDQDYIQIYKQKDASPPRLSITRRDPASPAVNPSSAINHVALVELIN